MRCRRALTMAAVLAAAGPACGEWPDVRPPIFDGERTVRALPERTTAVHVAASGRLLVYRLEALRVLAVFDVTGLRIIGYIPLPERDDLVAAGRDHLFIADTGTGRIQRWSLQTLEREYDGTLDGPTPLTGIGIGSCATGPLFVLSGKRGSPVQREDVALLDPLALKPLNLKRDTAGPDVQWRDGALSVSDDGRTCLAGKSGLLGHVRDSVFRFTAIQCTEYHRPGSDGRYCFGRSTPLAIDLPTGPAGAATLHAMSGSPAEDEDANDVWTTVNGVNSPFYLQVIEASDPNRGAFTIGGIAVAGSKESLTRFELFPYQITGTPSSMLIPDRVSFIPTAGVIVYVKSHDRELEIVKVDTQSVAAEAQYLVVDSPSVLPVTPGQDFTHQISVVTSFDQPGFVLDFGPEGMTLSASGELRWKVPRNPASAVEALVHVMAGERDQYHRIRLVAPRPAGPAPSATSPRALPEEVEAFVPGGGRHSISDPMRVERAPFEGTRLRRALPAPTDLVAVAGGGRFLVFHLVSLQKLALFDVNQAAIIGYIPTTGTDAFFAGGGDCVITGEAQSRTLRRWDLQTLRQQTRAVVDAETPLSGMLMGSASTQDLIVATRNGGAGVYNARTLRPLREGFDRTVQFYSSVMEGISADGGLLLMAASYDTGGGGGRFELTAFKRNGSAWEVRCVPKSRDFAFAMADGSFIADSTSVYDADTGQIVNRLPRGARYRLPAVHGNLHLTLDRNTMDVNVAGVFPPYVTIEPPLPIELPEHSPRTRIGALDQSVWFIPDADVLITLSPDRDVLNLYRLDVEQELEDSEDYLVVDKPPIITAQAGQEYKYQISARTKDGPIQFAVTSGPEGARLSGTGEIAWSVPADWTAPSQDFVVTLRNASGREVQHGWTVIFPALLPRQEL